MRSDSRGFTLLEILLVVAAIAILAGIVIVAINPAQQLGQTRNAQRRVDVRTIVEAIQQYQLKTGSLPAGIPSFATAASCNTSTNEICKTDGTCSGYIDLSVLTTNALYLTAIPVDPQGGTSALNSTGYDVMQVTSTGRVVVCAPKAELSESISAQE